MSININHPFPSDIDVKDLEPYNERVFRTVDTEYKLPWSREDLRFNSEFLLSDSINRRIHQIHDIISYLFGYAHIYNSVFPLDSVVCEEFANKEELVGIAMLPKQGNVQITYSRKAIFVYVDGILFKTINETELGSFKSIVDVIIQGEYLYIMDGGIVLKMSDYKTNPTFVTFFGGYGGKDAEYKFRSPTKFVCDANTNLIYVWDKGNGVVKQYTTDFSYISSFVMDGIDFDVFDGKVYILHDGYIDVKTKQTTTDYSIKIDLKKPTRILLDHVQAGFLWVASESRINKMGTNGLKIGTTTVDKFQDFIRSGTKLHVLGNSIWNNNLDFAFSQTVLDSDTTTMLKLLDNPVVCHPDEMCSDISMNRFIHGLNLLMETLFEITIGIFVEVRNANGGVQEIKVATQPPLDYKIVCGAFINSDEMVSCHTFNRVFGKMFDAFELYKEKMVVVVVTNNDNGGPPPPVNTSNKFQNEFNQNHLSPTSSNFNLSNLGFSLTDTNLEWSAYRTGFHTIKKITVKRGNFNFQGSNEDADKLQNLRLLLMSRLRVILAVSENAVNYNEVGYGGELVFNFPTTVNLTSLPDISEYKLGFISMVNNGMEYVNVDMQISATGFDIGYSFVDKNGLTQTGVRRYWDRYNESVKNHQLWLRVEGSADLVIDFNTDAPTNITPPNWQIGAHECEGIPPQLHNIYTTPISVEELLRPDLDCSPLTATPDGITSMPVSATPLPPNPIGGRMEGEDYICID